MRGSNIEHHVVTLKSIGPHYSYVPMTERTRAGDSVQELLDDVPYLWESQGPSGITRGRGAIEELLYRWEKLPDDWWDKHGYWKDELSMEMAVATIAHEADERGFDHNLYLDT
jgi:hypothetical protein